MKRLLPWVIAFMVVTASRRILMNIKDGVIFADTISPHIINIRKAVSDAWIHHNAGTPTITSSHRNDGGAHSRGEAEDYRIFDLSDSSLRFVLATDVSRALGTPYQAIVEDGTQRWYYRNGIYEGHAFVSKRSDPHLHVEFDGG